MEEFARVKLTNGSHAVIGVDDEDVIAEVDGKEIGRFVFKHIEYDPPTPDHLWLSHMQVDTAFHKQGIGTMMMKVAVGYFEHFFISTRLNGPNPLAIEGRRLVDACLRKKIITEYFLSDEVAP